MSFELWSCKWYYFSFLFQHVIILSREKKKVCFHNPQGLWPQDITPHPRQDPSELPGLQSWAEDMGPGLLCFCPGRAEGGGRASGVGLQRVGLGEAACNWHVSASQLMGRHGEGASSTKHTAALRPSGQGNCRGGASLPQWQQCSPRCSPPRCTPRCRRSAHSTGYTWHAHHGPLCTTSPSGDLLPLGSLEKSQGSKRSPQMGEGFRVAAQPGSSWQRHVDMSHAHVTTYSRVSPPGEMANLAPRQSSEGRASPSWPPYSDITSPGEASASTSPTQGLLGFFSSQDRDLPSREQPPVGSQCHLFWTGLLVPPPIPPHLLLPPSMSTSITRALADVP